MAIQDTVKMAYGNPDETGRLIEFYTDGRSAKVAQLCVKAIGQYNGFEGKAVAKVIEAIAKEYPQARFVVGREYSPVLYVKYYDATKDDLARIMDILRRAKPDELDWTQKLNDGYQQFGDIRAWWD